jgi:hypothetical protein
MENFPPSRKGICPRSSHRDSALWDERFAAYRSLLDSQLFAPVTHFAQTAFLVLLKFFTGIYWYSKESSGSRGKTFL